MLRPNPLSGRAREIQQEGDGAGRCRWRSGHKNYFYLFFHKKTREDKEPEGEKAQPWALGKSAEGMGQGSTPGTRGTGADEFRREGAGWKMQDGAGERGAEGVGWSWVQIPVQWLKIRETNHPSLPRLRGFPGCWNFSAKNRQSQSREDGWASYILAA